MKAKILMFVWVLIGITAIILLPIASMKIARDMVTPPETIIDTIYIPTTTFDTIQAKNWLYSKAGSERDSIIIAAVYHSDSLINPVTRILAICYLETRFKQGIINRSSGAKGLMQVLRSSAIACGLNYDSLNNIDYEILAGCRVMRVHYSFSKTISGAIKGYSGGAYNIWKLADIERNRVWRFLF